MHPKITSFLTEHPLEERPARRTLRRGVPSISFVASKLSKDPKALKQSRALPISLSLTETLAPQHPHRAGEKLLPNETERHREISNIKFCGIKRESF